MTKCLTFGIVAAEASGDALGADLMTRLTRQYPNATFIGIGGDQMRAHSCFECLYDMQTITAVGVLAVMRTYWRARRILYALATCFLQRKIDCLIAIDAPLFNMPLARRLKQAHIMTLLYVSPTYWAFRYQRLYDVMDAFYAIFCLYQFEVDDYQQHGFRAYYVAHPVLRTAALRLTAYAARAQLGLSIAPQTTLLACFLGSRASEIRAHTPVVLKLLERLRKRPQRWHFIFAVPSAMRETLSAYQGLFAAHDITLYYDKAHLCLSACDFALIKSGTSSLEAIVAAKPMIIYYYVSWVTRLVIYLLRAQRTFGLPNILARAQIVPELPCPTIEQLTNQLLTLLDQQTYKQQQKALLALRNTMEDDNVPIEIHILQLLTDWQTNNDSS